MKKILVLALVVLIGTPFLTFAKAKHIKGYEHSRGKEISVSEPLGWPIAVSSKSGHDYLDVSLESLPGMAVLKVKGYYPWWRVWSDVSATTTISVGGFPANTKLHVYTRGYRDHREVTTDKSGHLSLDVPSKEGQQFIIKAKPSTYHINLNGDIWNLFAKGGDCKAIGTWDVTNKTCTLTIDVNRDGMRTIAIEDDNITLDGNSHKVIGIGSDDGVYTDMSNVTVKNLNISGFARGIVYIASHGLIFSPPTGGNIQSVNLANIARNIHIEGMSDLSVINATSTGADTGLFISDLNLDGFPTYGITVTGSTIKNASTGAYIDNIDPITLTQNNWQGNGTDLYTKSSGVILSQLPERGNFWDKFVSCAQDPAPANPNHCNDRYDVPNTGVGDTLPWACKDGWKLGVTCSRVTLPPPPPTAVSFYTQIDSRWASKIYDHSDTVEQTCAATTSKMLTIKQCGCYITSVSNLLSLTALGTDSSGTTVTPDYVNTWLNANKGFTDDGDLDPSKISELTKSFSKTTKIEYQGGYNTADYGIDIVKQKLADSILAGVPVITFVPGQHFILTTATTSTSYSVQDPFWYLTSTLDDNASTSPSHKDYNNTIRGVRIYKKVQQDLASRFLQFFLGSPAYFVINDPLGRTIKYTPGITGSYSQVPDSSYWTDLIVDQEYGGPINREASKFVWINNPVDGTYTVTIVGTGSGNYKLAIRGDSTDTFDVATSTFTNKRDNYSLVVSGGIPISLTYLSSNSATSLNKTTICHIPPGNSRNAHTLYLPASAIQAHLAHGDILDKCPNESKESNEDNDKGDDIDKGDKIEKQDNKEKEVPSVKGLDDDKVEQGKGKKKNK